MMWIRGSPSDYFFAVVRLYLTARLPRCVIPSMNVLSAVDSDRSDGMEWYVDGIC
jgi:hypothetical protein